MSLIVRETELVAEDENRATVKGRAFVSVIKRALDRIRVFFMGITVYSYSRYPLQLLYFHCAPTLSG